VTRRIPDPIRPLTAQQRKVVDGIRRELAYAEIAQELGISVHTVRFHVREIANMLAEPDELPPRWRILMYAKQLEWEAQRPHLKPTGT
jgi:DNA-binding NarL/FixJ family response regulator